MFQVPPQKVKAGEDPKPFGYPLDITTLAVLSSSVQSNVVLGWYREVDKVSHSVIFTYLIRVAYICPLIKMTSCRYCVL